MAFFVRPSQVQIYIAQSIWCLIWKECFVEYKWILHVSTAGYLGFTDGARFYANLSDKSTLTSAPIAAFGFWVILRVRLPYRRVPSRFLWAKPYQSWAVILISRTILQVIYMHRADTLTLWVSPRQGKSMWAILAPPHFLHWGISLSYSRKEGSMPMATTPMAILSQEEP